MKSSALLALVVALPVALRAVSPLTTDDADTVEKRRVQFRLAGAFLQQDGTRQFTVPFNAICGVSSNCEAGATFGAQWERRRAGGETHGVEGALDTLLSVKYR